MHILKVAPDSRVLDDYNSGESNQFMRPSSERDLRSEPPQAAGEMFSLRPEISIGRAVC